MLEDWQREAVALFGEDPNRWRFKCPACGQVQGRPDFLALGINARMTDSAVGFSCIGKWRRRVPSNRVVEFGEMTRGDGCTYAGDGLFRVAPTLVVLDGTTARPTFGWDGELNEAATRGALRGPRRED